MGPRVGSFACSAVLKPGWHKRRSSPILTFPKTSLRLLSPDPPNSLFHLSLYALGVTRQWAHATVPADFCGCLTSYSECAACHRSALTRAVIDGCVACEIDCVHLR